VQLICRSATSGGIDQLSHQADYGVLDRPEILQFIFYPRRDWLPPPQGASDFLVPVEQGVSISCRFYPAGDESPCVLYFHGNGEVACEHDWLAQLYNTEGIGLFVADYRGYGLSDGMPSFASVTADAHSICNFFLEKVRPSGQDVPVFVMGRSLGSHCAVELAYHYPERFRGLIVESGSSNIARLLELFGIRSERLSSLGEAITGRLRSITLPALIIHGEWDSLIPLDEAIKLHEDIASQEKRLVVVRGADHNSIMAVGMEQYLAAVKEFVFDHCEAIDKDGPA
jgi:pimeloyl-ACP methyl ester carboxylesterase